MTSLAVALFCICVFLLSVPLLLYPLALYVVARFRPSLAAGNAFPSVSLIISAYNESAVIRDKLKNAIELQYPKDKLEVLVISDASDDGTDEIVAEFSGDRVHLCRQEERRGKSAGLSKFCPDAQGDVIVFTDANSMFRPDAVEKLVRHFDDPRVGYTVGTQRYDENDQTASAESEKAYWNFELMQKELESRVSSVVGADGAIYALRKELFEPLAPEDINDFVLPLKVVAKGYRGQFDSEAICYESAAPSFEGEFRRKYRIVNRSLRAVLKVPSSLNPFCVGIFAFQLLGHKVLRWFTPVFLLGALGTSTYLAINGVSPFAVLLAVQLCGYLLAACYAIPMLKNVRLIYIAYYFLLMNVASLCGIALLLSGRTIGVWKPQR